MTRGEAAEVLGVSPGASTSEADQAFQAKHASLADRIERAPTPALAGKYRKAQERLAEARGVLVEPARPSGSALSHTMMQDLPSAAPVRTAFGGTGEGEPQVSLPPGRLLADRYTIDRLLGLGGMGAVYAAHDSMREEEVALKVLRPELLSNEEARQRFLDEARMASRLSHPGIARVFDIRRDGDLHFITMELLEGRSLRQEIDARKFEGRRFEVETVRHLGIELAKALSHAHRTTVHRDVKPDNIWLQDTGEAKVMDFGIARAVSGNSTMTRAGAALGTAYYMAPEQLSDPGSVDGRADQYALAVVLHELLTGHLLAGRVESVRAGRPDTPRPLAAAIDQALSASPDQRFPDMDAFAEALAQTGDSRKLLLPLVAVVVLGLVFLLGALALAPSGSEAPAPTAQSSVDPRHRAIELRATVDLERDRLAEREEEAPAEVASQVFGSGEWAELAGSLQVADALIADEHWEAVIPRLDAARMQLTTLSDRLDALLVPEKPDPKTIASSAAVVSKPKPVNPLAKLEKRCSAGDGAVCSDLGSRYRTGGGGASKSAAAAASWYRKGCDAGDGGGCVGLAFYVQNGLGGQARDSAAAAELRAKACRLGRSDACR